MISNNMTFLGCEKTWNTSKVVLFGAPFDGTTSFRPGTRFAPQTMRLDSVGLELYSPYQDLDLHQAYVHDAGDVNVMFGNTKETLKSIKAQTRKIVQADKIPLMLGGEHLVSLPAIEAVHERYPDLHVIQFDAHGDLRDDFEGERYSHATVMRRVLDLLGDKRLAQFGIRSGPKEEFEYAKTATFMEPFTAQTLDARVLAWKDKPVYVTVDLDVLDPGVFPGTGTPEPGGWSFEALRLALMKLKPLNIVGFDIVELSPHYDHSGASTAVACKLTREVLLMLNEIKSTKG